MLRRAYDWCIAAAHKPYALWLMGFVSFVESSFFPVPPDVMLGFHFCYGDNPLSPKPADTATMVRVAHCLTAGLRRPLDWLHMPVPIERDGKIIEWVGASTDVTGQREAEEMRGRLTEQLSNPLAELFELGLDRVALGEASGNLLAELVALADHPIHFALQSRSLLFRRGQSAAENVARGRSGPEILFELAHLEFQGLDPFRGGRSARGPPRAAPQAHRCN